MTVLHTLHQNNVQGDDISPSSPSLVNTQVQRLALAFGAGIAGMTNNEERRKLLLKVLLEMLQFL